MNPFRWKNCFADVQACKHDITIESFLSDVILPAITALNQRITALSRSERPGDEFARADMQDVLKQTKMAFALSVQSIWERQIREYLLRCATELRPGIDLSPKIERADWKGLCALFQDLRGIGLRAFPSYDDLEVLHLVGNACRHGDGASAVTLAERCPDLWPPRIPLPPEFQAPVPRPPSVAMMDISIRRIEVFVAAIAAFWRDAEYIYNESIERKDPSLEAHLERERERRNWLPQATEGA